MERRRKIENLVLLVVGAIMVLAAVFSMILRPEALTCFYGADVILFGAGTIWIGLFRDASFLKLSEEKKKRFAYLWGGFLFSLGFLGFLFLERYANSSMQDLVPPSQSSSFGETNSIYVFLGSLLLASYLVFGLFKNNRYEEEDALHFRRILRNAPFLLLILLGVTAFALAQDDLSLYGIVLAYLWIPLLVFLIAALLRLFLSRFRAVKVVSGFLLLSCLVSFVVFGFLL